MKNFTWIMSELRHRQGCFASLPQSYALCENWNLQPRATLADQVRETPCDSITLGEAAARVVASEVGLWYHARWDDQTDAIPSRPVKGDARLMGTCLALLDSDPAWENGDMAAGFVSLQSDWVLFIKVSRERRCIVASLRAADAPTMEELMRRLDFR